MNKINKLFWIMSLVLLISVSVVSAVPTAPDSADCVTYMKFDDLTDEVGTISVTMTGATSVANGIIGNTYSYDGSNDYLDFNYKFDYPERTYSYWTKLPSFDTYVLDGRSAGQGFDIWSGGGARVVTSSGVYSTAGYSFSVNTWTYHTITYSESTNELKYYQNAVLKETKSFTGTTTDELDLTAMILNPQLNPSQEGYFDEFAFFDVVLTQDEIDYLYNSGSPTSAQQYPFSSGFAYHSEITDITFYPTTVYAHNTISATVTVNDSTDIDLKYYWLVNGVNKTSGTVTTASVNVFTIPSLASTNYVYGDTIMLDTVAILESNSSQASNKYNDTKTVSEVPIIQGNIVISPSTLYTNTDASASVTLSYYSGVDLYYVWQVDGTNISSGTVTTETSGVYTIPSFSSSNFAQTDDVTLTVTPKSGTENLADPVTSTTKTVSNRAPTLVSITNSPNPPIDTVDLNFYCQFNDADGDTFSIGSNIYINDSLQAYSNTVLNVPSGTIQLVNTAPNSILNVGDEIYVQCTAVDPFGLSSGTQQGSTLTIEEVNNFTVTAKEWFNETVINDFWININGTIFNTTDGSIVTPYLTNSTTKYTLSVGSDNYFTEYVLTEDAPFALVSNYEAFLKQSIINFNSYDLSNNLMTQSINYTIEGVTFPSNYSFYLPKRNEFSPQYYTVIVEPTGYYPLNYTFTVDYLDNKTVNVTGLYNSVVNFSAFKASDNSSINSFSGYLYNTANDYNVSFSTTTGSVTVPFLNNTAFSYVVSADGFASVSGNDTTNSSLYGVNTTHYTFNSVRINIYNDTSNDLLTSNVTVSTLWNGASMINSTNNGTLYFDLLTPEDYELRFSSPGYLNTSLFIIVTNDSTQEVNIHLAVASGKELQRFYVVDQVGDDVSGAIIRLQVEVPGFDGLWQTVDEKKTNNDGETGFYVDKSTNVFYRMIVIYDGVVELVTDKTLFLPGIDEIISLQIDTSAVGDSNLVRNVVTSLVRSGTNNATVTFSWVDPDNAISGARMVIYVKDFNITGLPSEVLYTVSSSDFTGSFNYTLPVVNDTEFTVKCYILWSDSDELAEEIKIIFGRNILTDQNFGLLIAFAIVVLAAFITISLGPLFSSLISFGLLAVLAGFTLISVPVTIITSFIALAVIFFIKLKGGGQ